jgi:hypothetical protein
MELELEPVCHTQCFLQVLHFITKYFLWVRLERDPARFSRTLKLYRVIKKSLVTMQKVTSNVQSVPRQAPDTY